MYRYNIRNKEKSERHRVFDENIKSKNPNIFLSEDLKYTFIIFRQKL